MAFSFFQNCACILCLLNYLQFLASVLKHAIEPLPSTPRRIVPHVVFKSSCANSVLVHQTQIAAASQQKAQVAIEGCCTLLRCCAVVGVRRLWRTRLSAVYQLTNPHIKPTPQHLQHICIIPPVQYVPHDGMIIFSKADELFSYIPGTYYTIEDCFHTVVG